MTTTPANPTPTNPGPKMFIKYELRHVDDSLSATDPNSITILGYEWFEATDPQKPKLFKVSESGIQYVPTDQWKVEFSKPDPIYYG